MRAFHIYSTAPFFAKNPGKDPLIDKSEAYCTVLSALEWRKHNGEIHMITDKHGAGLFNRLGIVSVWDRLEDTLAPDVGGIDPLMFWAGAKLLALRDFPAPCVMLDTDFIVWERLDLSDKMTAAHEEELNPDIYPNISRFQLREYTFPDNLDLSVKPLNTAFLYIPDEDFKLYYTSQAAAFMRSAVRSDDFLTYMVFAEQRLLPMLAKKCGIEYGTLLNKDYLFFPQDKFTHLWGAKQAMRDDPSESEKFCNKCKNRILSDFPEYSFVVNNIEEFYSGC
ncbi:MAG: hypothetical protein J1E39_09560 [Eubacterium sp.]|nr:hypothetical protein [Eubacterium sp.]